MRKVTILILMALYCSIRSQKVTKNIVHMCDPWISGSCGPYGSCVVKKTGNRCRCPTGTMGIKCKRPCEDIYKSCSRWKEEGRCDWTKPILPFFEDNCAQTCQICRSDGKRLRMAVPPMLEPIVWLAGRWETTTVFGEHFPVSLKGGYHEVMDISISEVPMFDRPALNISVTSKTLDKQDGYREVGFITTKPFIENTGFLIDEKVTKGYDKIAIEMVSSAGLITIEIGEMRGDEIVLELSYFKTMFPSQIQHVIKKSTRTIRNVQQGMLTEVGYVEREDGTTQRWTKSYQRTTDYLSPV